MKDYRKPFDKILYKVFWGIGFILSISKYVSTRMALLFHVSLIEMQDKT